jgi:hypothetical protein
MGQYWRGHILKDSLACRRFSILDSSPRCDARDFVLVDANHEHQNLVSDTRKARPMLATDGAIIRDDHHIPHPMETRTNA